MSEGEVGHESFIRSGKIASRGIAFSDPGRDHWRMWFNPGSTPYFYLHNQESAFLEALSADRSLSKHARIRAIIYRTLVQIGLT